MIRAALLLAFVAFTIYGVTIALTAPGDGLNDAANTVVYPALFVLAVIVAAGESADRPPRQARVERRSRRRSSRGATPRSTTSSCNPMPIRRLPTPAGSPSTRSSTPGSSSSSVGGRGTSRGTLWVDGITASVAGAAIGSAVLLEVVLRATEGTPSEVATNLAYPVGDVLLLSAVFGILALSGWRRRAPVARPRGRRPRDGDRRRHLPVTARHVRGGLRPGHPLACVRAPDRGRRMGRGS